VRVEGETLGKGEGVKGRKGEEEKGRLREGVSCSHHSVVKYL